MKNITRTLGALAFCALAGLSGYGCGNAKERAAYDFFLYKKCGTIEVCIRSPYPYFEAAIDLRRKNPELEDIPPTEIADYIKGKYNRDLDYPDLIKAGKKTIIIPKYDCGKDQEENPSKPQEAEK